MEKTYEKVNIKNYLLHILLNTFHFVNLLDKYF